MSDALNDPGTWARIRALIEICAKESHYLQRCDARLFNTPISVEQVKLLPENDDLAERVDAFVARFGRLQDTIGDKLVPEFLKVMQESRGTMLENLDRLERLGLIESSDVWAALRKLRNRMIHEYVKDAAELADALNAAHEHVKMLINAHLAIVGRMVDRFPQLC